MIDYVESVRRESARVSEVVHGLALETLVPSCPDWSAADLTWHLAEVQNFWAQIAGGLLQDPELVQRDDRPEDEALADYFDVQAGRLVEALAAHEPDAACWSWHEADQSVGWVRRRQAHEALIHRIDAELAAGTVTSIDPTLAADGVDEILRVMLDATDLPGWARFTPSAGAVIELADGSASWSMELGRFTGTSPNSGTTYDDAALRLVDGVEHPRATVRAAAPELDLWLWGRGSIDAVSVDGDPSIAEHIREAAVDGTQ